MSRRLSMSSKREITKKYAQGYKRLTKAEKKAVLDHLCATCGWTRKHATKVLSNACEQTNPAELMRQIVKLQCRLLELAKVPSDVEMKHEQLVKTLLEEVA
ncbi:hypothetical protein FACS189481_3760 [Clostridia bacterium]|nr:hypothetical protein FACS189481_3760 [Clostridia bacterium]